MNKLIITFVSLILFNASVLAAESPWNLPAKLSASNTKLNYNLDTTWHEVDGQVKNLTGEAYLATSTDYRSIRAKVSFNVADMDSDNESRDETMREVMTAEKYPDINFVLSSIEEICKPEEVKTDLPCDYKGTGKIRIRDITANIPINGQIFKTEKAYKVTGQTEFNWGDFGIEDPSIFIAKVKPTVRISFELQL